MKSAQLFEFDRQRLFTDVGTLILSRLLMQRPRSLRLENVERNPAYQRRGIDLIWQRAIKHYQVFDNVHQTVIGT